MRSARYGFLGAGARLQWRGDLRIDLGDRASAEGRIGCDGGHYD